MAETLESNLELFSKLDPKASFALQDPYSDHLHQVDDENISVRTDAVAFPLHAPDEKFETPKEGVQVLYVYGAGLGRLYEAAKEWLKHDPKRRLVFLEDDPAILRELLARERGTEILRDPQTHLYLYDATLNDLLTWRFVSKPCAWTALPSYKKYKAEQYKELQSTLSHAQERKNEAIEEYLDHGISFFRNFYPNLFELPYALYGPDLFGKFQGVPAIICGAGPSLEKQLPHLKALKDQALILAGGSSLLAVSRFGIEPHFAAGIDPNSPHYQRLLNHRAYMVPFFYRGRIYAPALRTVHGPRLYIPGTGGYDTACWFEERFGIKEAEEIDEGHNVVNFLTSIAAALGCDPIIYVGLDLAYTGEKLYASGVMTTESMTRGTYAHLENEADLTQVVKDIEGNPIKTHSKWIAEAKWLSDFTKEHPKRRFLNATEGGMGVEGIENLTLSKATKDLPPLFSIEKADSATPLSVKTEEIIEALDSLKKSLRRCIEQLSKLIEEQKRLVGTEEAYPSGVMSVLEVELQEEEGYFAVLAIFDHVFMHTQMGDRRDLYKYPAEERRAREIALDVLRLAFLLETAKTNCVLIDEALSEKIESPSGEQMIIPPKNSGNENKHFYYPNGSLKAEIAYKDGELHGVTTLYHPNGHPRRKIAIFDGLREGRDILWYRNGNIELEAYYQHDIPVRSLKRYYPSGQIAEEVVYHTSPAHYDVRKWNSKGQLMLECIYKDETECTLKEWSTEGTLLTEKAGRFDGVKLTFIR